MVLDDRAALPPAAGTPPDDVAAVLDAALAAPGGLVDAAVRRLVRDAPIGFAVLDADLRYVLVNEFLERYSGLPSAQIVGRTVREIVPSVADVAEAAFRGVLETGEPLRDLALTGDVPGDPGRVRHWRESVFRVETTGSDLPRPGLAVLVWEVTEQVEAHRALLDAQDRLRFLARSSDLLSRSLDEDAVLDELTGLLVPDVATAVDVLLPDGAGRLVPARSGTTFTPSTAAAAAFAQQRAVHEAGTVWAPMVVRGRSTGVVAAVVPDAGADDVALVATIARRSAVALANARLYGQQSRIAERLQQSLLPSALPEVPGASLAVHYAAADEAVEVGGDFYDVFPVGDGRYVLVIGDVAGRGLDAAGMTGLARHTIRALAHDCEPAAVLSRLNEALLAQQHEERFLTAVCAVLDLEPALRGGPDGARALLTYANAGHCRPVVRGRDGETVLLDATGALLGVLPDARIAQRTVPLLDGDALVLCTDGITEARRDGDLFGEEGLVTALAGAGRDPVADGVAARVVGAVEEFQTAPAADDRALLVLALHATR